jgi:hypothetical protein
MSPARLACLALYVAGCCHPVPPRVATTPSPPLDPAIPRDYGRLTRLEFNRLAVRANLPLFWVADHNRNGEVNPAEIVELLFYGSSAAGPWVHGSALNPGEFTPEFASTYDELVRASNAPAPTGDDAVRQLLVASDLDQGRPTLVHTDFTTAGAEDKLLVQHMLRVAELIDELYLRQTGATATLEPASDLASQSLFRRNRGPACVAPKTEHDPACSAIPGATKVLVDVYPPELQLRAEFCSELEKAPGADALLSPFSVIRATADGPAAVAYTQAYREPMTAIADELRQAARDVRDPNEAALVRYLRAAADSFVSNDWTGADEAWAKMSVASSRWYLRVAPDEVYWDPCGRKAAFHLTFARINKGSVEWQQKLAPHLATMESLVSERAGRPYAPRKVEFHLPDFIDIVLNAGDDRGPLGATVGQSLPNWGPVANEGRGRTVAMSNLYTDPDSLAASRDKARSLLDATSAADHVDDPAPGLLATVLHEAMHNLGPAHQYQVGGNTDDAVFGGPLAGVMEELKAQTGALFLAEFLRGRNMISDQFARRLYADSIVWALGHIAEGMYDKDGHRKTYSNLAAIQVGYLMEHGALRWSPDALAANGTDRGAFTIDQNRLVPAIAALMQVVAGAKARGDRRLAEELSAKYVDGEVVPQATIRERFSRAPKVSFVYAVTL